MEQKLALRAKLDAATRNAPVPLPDTRDWDAWRFRPVLASGTFDASHQVLLDNRIHEGRPGFLVVTPLVLADGRTVLVDRGWVAAGATRDALPSMPPPTGTVTIAGRVNQPPASYLELSTETARGPVWQNLNLARYEDATGLRVLPVVVEQTSATDEKDKLVRDRPAPDLGVERYLELMGHDKKVQGGRMRFILVKHLGEAFISADVPRTALDEVLAHA